MKFQLLFPSISNESCVQVSIPCVYDTELRYCGTIAGRTTSLGYHVYLRRVRKRSIIRPRHSENEALQICTIMNNEEIYTVELRLCAPYPLHHIYTTSLLSYYPLLSSPRNASILQTYTAPKALHQLPDHLEHPSPTLKPTPFNPSTKQSSSQS